MSIQLVVAAKPELFDSGQLPERYSPFFRDLKGLSFPSDTGCDRVVLARLAKQLFIAHMRTELGDEFFGGNASLTTEFFDRWWTIRHAEEIPEDELTDCEVEPAPDVFESLEKSDRDQIYSMQSDDVRAEIKKMLEFDDRPQGFEAGGILYAETDYFTPFPDPSTVFANDVETHLKYLLPLATVSLKHINPAWSGQIHFVQPIEPYDGCIGENTTSHHSPLCAQNWVGYRMDEQGRYTLATDWDYFLMRNLDTRSDFQPGGEEKQELHDLYERARQSYAVNQGHFQEFHALHPSYSLEEYGAYRDRDRHGLVMQLGGKPGWGNCVETGDWPISSYLSDEEDDTDYFPQADDGTDFSYIGWLHSFVYVESSGCSLQLFYHPELRLALTTFDWS